MKESFGQPPLPPSEDPLIEEVWQDWNKATEAAHAEDREMLETVRNAPAHAEAIAALKRNPKSLTLVSAFLRRFYMDPRIIRPEDRKAVEALGQEGGGVLAAAESLQTDLAQGASAEDIIAHLEAIVLPISRKIANAEKYDFDDIKTDEHDVIPPGEQHD